MSTPAQWPFALGKTPLAAIEIPRGQTGQIISAMAPLLLSGKRAHFVDGGNAFDPYKLGTRLRGEGLDPRPIFDQMLITRAYTCHQLLGVVEGMLPRLLVQPTLPLVTVLGIDGLFHDEDIPLWERRYLFGRILQNVAALAGRGLPFLLTLTPAPNNPWRGEVARVAPLLPSPAALMNPMRGAISDGTHDSDIQPMAATGNGYLGGLPSRPAP